MAPSDSTAPRTASTDPRGTIRQVLLVLGRAKAVLLFISAVAAAIFLPIILALLQPIREKLDAGDESLSAPIAWLFDLGPASALLVLPALLLAVVAGVAQRGHIIWLLASLFALLIPVLLILIAFVQVVAPMYDIDRL